MIPLLVLALLLSYLLPRRASVDDSGRAPADAASAAGGNAASTVTKTPGSAADAVSDAAAGLGAMVERALPNSPSLRVPENGIESRLLAFVTDAGRPVDDTTWFSFDRLEFETGSAELRPSSNEQLDNIAAILKAYPNVKLKVGGYTDNTGDPAAHQSLSTARAQNTMAAIVARGIAATRLTAEGYGEQHPVASNTTEEGRARNRRIDLRVTAK